MSKYDIAIFDADGTLLDTTQGILHALNYTIKELGLPELSKEVILSLIGPPIQDSLGKTYGLEGEELAQAAQIFRNRYKDYDLLKAHPYEGIMDIFDELKKRDIKLAVATYKRQDYATDILNHFGFNRHTNLLFGSDFEGKLKKVDIIKKCLDEAGIIDYSRAVMIGDTAHDALGAKELGVDFIGVTYGFEFKSKEDVEQYPCIGSVDNAKDLLSYF